MWNKNLFFALGFAALSITQYCFAQSAAPKNDASTAAMVQTCNKSGDIDAQNFCFGFGEGVYQSFLVDHANGSRPLICLPKSGDTREDILKAFLSWNKENPQFNQEPAAKTIIQFLKLHYSCK